jgi:hypothetical protein
MSIFESTTTEITSPEGQEEQVADVNESTSEASEQVEEQVEAQEEQHVEQQEQKPFDYMKAYNELRRDYTRKSQELAQLRKQQPAQNQAPVQGQGNDLEGFWAAMQQDPIGTIQKVAQYQAQSMVAPLYEQQQQVKLAQNFEAVSKEYPQLADQNAMQSLFEKVKEIYMEETGSTNQAHYPSKRILKMAAAELYGDTTSRVYQQAKKAGQEEAMNNIRQKQGLSVNAGVKPKDTPKTFEEEYRESIINAGRKGGVFG